MKYSEKLMEIPDGEYTLVNVIHSKVNLSSSQINQRASKKNLGPENPSVNLTNTKHYTL